MNTTIEEEPDVVLIPQVEKLMTRSEVARILRVGPQTVDRLAIGGKLKFVQIQSMRRYTASQVRDYIASASRQA